MRWKLTTRFLLSVLSIVIIVIFVNTAILIGLLIYQQTANFHDTYRDNEIQFVRDFGHYIQAQDNPIAIDPEGVEQLNTHQAWIQVLNDNGDVIASHNTPENLLTHYSPFDVIQNYKYKEVDTDTIVYVGKTEDVNYLIGIRGSNISRFVFHISETSVLQWLGKFGLLVVLADLLVATLIGLLFGRTLTKPLYSLIEQIQHLSNRKDVKIKTPNGLYAPVFANLHEVSNELAAHEMERKRLEMLREEWISNVSHDMKTPLASIRGYAELLNDGGLTSTEQATYTQIIEKQALHMQELLDDLNLTMRLRHQQLPLQRSQVNLVPFIREIVIDTLNMPPYEHANIRFETSKERIVHSIDEHFMRRAVVNFLYNALLHNPQDVEINVYVEENSITIADNGHGIAAEDLNRIFERYYRGTNTAHSHGTGLGTAIARDIVEAHGGTVSITSQENEGTTVSIHLTSKPKETSR